MEVPLSKRHKLIGTGGHKIRALVEETGKRHLFVDPSMHYLTCTVCGCCKGLIICMITGAQLTTVDDEIMSIFAPSQTVMDEVLERVDILMNAPDPEVTAN